MLKNTFLRYNNFFRICKRYNFISTNLVGDDRFFVENKFDNVDEQKKILDNIRKRDCVDDFGSLFIDNISADEIKAELLKNARRLPNSYHPIWNEKNHELDIIEQIGGEKQPKMKFKPKKAENLLYSLKNARFSDLNFGRLGIAGGRRSYSFEGNLAKLSRTLVRWTMSELITKHQFTPVVIPNLLRSDIIRSCGFEPHGTRTQVYSLEHSPDICVAGTAEMPLASLHLGETFNSQEELPKKYCAVSRCYRAEAKSGGEMSGLYRVHYFDKVEMFALTESGKSEVMFNEFINIQRSLFQSLDLNFRVIDMPPFELGPSAHRKFDMEAIMPGRDNFWGELSSASDCTDYQAKRLNITYKDFQYNDQNEIIGVQQKFVNTVNGTACALPRIIIAISEQNQLDDGRIRLPDVLQEFMKSEYL